MDSGKVKATVARMWAFELVVPLVHSSVTDRDFVTWLEHHEKWSTGEYAFSILGTIHNLGCARRHEVLDMAFSDDEHFWTPVHEIEPLTFGPISSCGSKSVTGRTLGKCPGEEVAELCKHLLPERTAFLCHML